MIRFALYIGAGAVCHAAFVGAAFNPTDSWSVAWLLFWPILLFFKFFAYFLMIAAIMAAAVVLYWLIFVKLRHWRRNRTIRNIGRKARSS